MSSKRKIKVLYLTTTSKLSGAEKMVYELASRLNGEKYEIMVCTIKDDLEGGLLDKLKEEKIKTECLNLDKKWKIWKVFKLYEILKTFSPDIIHTHLFHTDFLGRIFNLIAGKKVKVVST